MILPISGVGPASWEFDPYFDIRSHFQRVALPAPGGEPTVVRIVAVADVVEAMASHRPYRPAVGLDSALTELEQQLYNFKLGEDYPEPIVDIKRNRKRASDILWGLKKDPLVKTENQRILSKHTIKDRSKMLNSDWTIKSVNFCLTFKLFS